MINIKKIIQIFTFSFFFVLNGFSYADFNDDKLILTCSYFSKDQISCQKEVDFLSEKNKKNSVVSYCYSNYSTIKGFSDCLKYEYNPLVFLKYKNERAISSLKEMNLKKNIVNFCGKGNPSISESKCLEMSYVTLEKSKNELHWIESYCVFNNKEIESVFSCISDIKKEAKNDNNLLNTIPTIIKTTSDLENLYKSKRNIYFEEVYKKCSEKYNRMNSYICIEKEIDPIKDYFVNLNLKSVLCSEKNSFEQYKICLFKIK